MSTFSASAVAYLARRGSDPARAALWREFESVGLPTTVDEVWRYAPLSTFHLDNYVVADPPDATAFTANIDELTHDAAVVIRILDGRLLDPTSEVVGLAVTTADLNANETTTFGDRYSADAFALLNGALTPACTSLSVGAGTQIAGTVVVVHQVTSQAVFPNTRVELGRGSRLELVECYVGGDGALVVPVSEYIIGDNAELHVATYQRLATTSWHVARTTTHLARDARMRQLIIGLGGHYNRSRNDAEFDGTGSTNELHTTFLGAGDQVHDFRTRQYHRIGRSTSNLLSKGAVADHARSVYTGLIEIEKGAKRTDARQRNLNLLLAPTAHADTVPNLDIRENDVMCAHASSVGPLDEMQRWYLESRGVERNAAERLLVQGFFNEMTDSMPTGIAKMVDRDVAKVLETTQLVTP